jgi:hypothetical protein
MLSRVRPRSSAPALAFDTGEAFIAHLRQAERGEVELAALLEGG